MGGRLKAVVAAMEGSCGADLGVPFQVEQGPHELDLSDGCELDEAAYECGVLDDLDLFLLLGRQRVLLGAAGARGTAGGGRRLPREVEAERAPPAVLTRESGVEEGGGGASLVMEALGVRREEEVVEMEEEADICSLLSSTPRLDTPIADDGVITESGIAADAAFSVGRSAGRGGWRR